MGAVVDLAEDLAIPEGTDALYTCKFREAAPGQPALNANAIVSITATLKDVASGLVINERNNQNVLNANGGALAADGTFSLLLNGQGDNVVNGEKAGLERHRLTIKVVYTRNLTGDQGHLVRQIQFWVRDIPDA